ncbi:MAG: hypothetical protein IKK10_01325 [Clostridia bacterium]|nr:hypothetical protein [Clostridia bacterium]
MDPEIVYTSSTVNINGSVDDSKALVNVTINKEHINQQGESDPNIRIYNSNMIQDRKAQETILNIIIESPEFDPEVFTRSKESWLAEWRGHNAVFIFGHASWRENTRHVDLNELEDRPWDLIW